MSLVPARSHLRYALALIPLLFLVSCGSDDDSGTSPPPPEIPVNSIAPDSAAVGDTITVTGDDFGTSTDSITVRFGDVTVNPISASNQQLRVEIPPGATTAPVRLTRAGLGGESPNDLVILFDAVSASELPSPCLDLIWTGDLFVAVGGAGVVATSPDGIDWTQRSTPTGASLNAVVSNGSGVVAVSAAGSIINSPNGVVWTNAGSGYDALIDVAASNSRFVAIPDHADYVLSSSFGATWQQHAIDTSLTFTTAVYAGRFHAFADELWVLTSLDGLSWTRELSNLVSPSPIGSAWSGQLLVVGKPFTLLKRQTAQIYTVVGYGSSSLSGQYTDIGWGGNRFVAVAGEVVASEQGTDWEKVAAFPYGPFGTCQIASSDSVCVVTGFGNQVMIWRRQ
ncbi:hypothetical protein GF377_04270 [candidate division GN15 bacterium]|nr:hypothetical protein [candidate division GN15 bacterium]